MVTALQPADHFRVDVNGCAQLAHFFLKHLAFAEEGSNANVQAFVKGGTFSTRARGGDGVSCGLWHCLTLNHSFRDYDAGPVNVV